MKNQQPLFSQFSRHCKYFSTNFFFSFLLMLLGRGFSFALMEICIFWFIPDAVSTDANWLTARGNQLKRVRVKKRMSCITKRKLYIRLLDGVCVCFVISLKTKHILIHREDDSVIFLHLHNDLVCKLEKFQVFRLQRTFTFMRTPLKVN